MTAAPARAALPPAGLVALLLTAALGLGLAAAFFYTGWVDGAFIAGFQERLQGAHSGPGLALALALALVIGASMVVLPCGFPAVFLMPSLLERERAGGRLHALAAFTLGGVLPLAAAGALLGAAGGGLWDALRGDGRIVFAAVLYPLLGGVVLAYACVQLGVLSLSGAFARWRPPPLPGPAAPARRGAVLGATFGAGIGIACPMPTYYALLAWVAVAASPWYGAVVLGAYGLGRVVPAIAVGLVIVAGARRRDVSRALVAWHGPIAWLSAVIMAAMGVFLIALFGGFIGTSLI